MNVYTNAMQLNINIFSGTGAGLHVVFQTEAKSISSLVAVILW